MQHPEHKFVAALLLISVACSASAHEDLTVKLIPGPGGEPGLATLIEADDDKTDISVNLSGDLAGSTLPGRTAELRSGRCDAASSEVVASTYLTSTSSPRTSLTGTAGLFSGYGEFDLPLDEFTSGERSLHVVYQNSDDEPVDTSKPSACGNLP